MVEFSKGKLACFDFDTWTYDIPFAAQRLEDDGETLVLSFDYCRDLVDARFEEIMKKLGCTEYVGYLTGSGNFRHETAVTYPYKGNRAQERPWHYQNIRNYLEYSYGAEVVHGIEADDALAIKATEEGDNAIIISRDKDLRMVQGWHYGYEVGNQPEFGPKYYNELGELDVQKKSGKNKVSGGGLKFFYTQMITGDSTDNIKGPKGKGPMFAYRKLVECQTEEEMQGIVIDVYKEAYGEDAIQRYNENKDLLWMVREMKDGQPVLKENILG